MEIFEIDTSICVSQTLEEERIKNNSIPKIKFFIDKKWLTNTIETLYCSQHSLFAARAHQFRTRILVVHLVWEEVILKNSITCLNRSEYCNRSEYSFIPFLVELFACSLITLFFSWFADGWSKNKFFQFAFHFVFILLPKKITL